MRSIGPLSSSVYLGLRFSVALWVTTFSVVVQCQVLDFPFESVTLRVWCLVSQWQQTAQNQKYPGVFLIHSQYFQKFQPWSMFLRQDPNLLQIQPTIKYSTYEPPIIPAIAPIQMIPLIQSMSPEVTPPTKSRVAIKACQWHDDFLECNLFASEAKSTQSSWQASCASGPVSTGGDGDGGRLAVFWEYGLCYVDGSSCQLGASPQYLTCQQGLSIFQVKCQYYDGISLSNSPNKNDQSSTIVDVRQSDHFSIHFLFLNVILPLVLQSLNSCHCRSEEISLIP